MAARTRKPAIFFAIPCGEFYSIQARIIQEVCAAAGVNPIIIEGHAQTQALWKKIADRIDSADFVLADISSGSPNIALELGYAMREKSIRKIGIFISSSARVPVDLQGFVLQKYMSFRDFQSKLCRWLVELMPPLDPAVFESLQDQYAYFHEDFKDQETFLRLWSFSPGASFLLGPEGLRFSNAHFPIMSSALALLRDCEFEFRARINHQTIGWIVKGTKPPGHLFPTFCVMFNLDSQGNLRPHIYNERRIDPSSYYQVFPDHTINVRRSIDGWFTLITRVRGDVIEIENEGQVVFTADFSSDPYGPIYNDISQKEGQVGFRCHPSEEATINYVKVREI